MPDLLYPSSKCFKVSVYTSVQYIPHGNNFYNSLKSEFETARCKLRASQKWKKRKYLISGMKLEEYTVINMKWMWGRKPVSNVAEDFICFINPHRPAHSNITYCMINTALNQYLTSKQY